jgi:hypothetical protein
MKDQPRPVKQPDDLDTTEPVTAEASPPPTKPFDVRPEEPTPRMCDVQGCAEDAVTEINGDLRLNPGEEPSQWIAVEFNLCPTHEADHDRCYGEPPTVSEPKETVVQP